MPANAESCARYRQRLKNRALHALGGFWPVCRDCGADEGLQFAHVKPTELNGCSRGLTRRCLDVLRHIDCYVLLCDECHKEFDKRVPF